MYYKITLASYFILLFGQVLWIGWLNPVTLIPKSVTLLFIVAPLLLPMRGLLHANFRTFKWVTLFIWLYFIIGVWNCANATQWPLGALQVVTSLLIFVSAVMYCRQLDTRPKKEA
mgnify:CR=1 FL=1|jgi:uncharacterized membrane protein|tara:strand:- start:499 stop:843 length:345 start_codon:yes stop_codon:yes gene_type:complete